MTSDILDGLEGWVIADMWCPLPITPECLSGVENMEVDVRCDDTVAEHFFGQAGCDHLRREIVTILREVGVESDPERISDDPAVPGLMVSINMEEEDKAVRFLCGPPS